MICGATHLKSQESYIVKWHVKKADGCRGRVVVEGDEGSGEARTHVASVALVEAWSVRGGSWRGNVNTFFFASISMIRFAREYDVHAQGCAFSAAVVLCSCCTPRVVHRVLLSLPSRAQFTPPLSTQSILINGIENKTSSPRRSIPHNHSNRTVPKHATSSTSSSSGIFVYSFSPQIDTVPPSLENTTTKG